LLLNRPDVIELEFECSLVQGRRFPFHQPVHQQLLLATLDPTPKPKVKNQQGKYYRVSIGEELLPDWPTHCQDPDRVPSVIPAST
jgi:hypothetical protein